MEIFKDRLKKLRLQRKLTRKELAQAIGVSPSSIYCWEKGACLPNFIATIKLVQYFNVSMSFLFGLID